MKRMILNIVIVSTFILVGCGGSSDRELPGLVGIYFSEPNLTSIKALSVLTSLEQVWGQDYEYGRESSGRWNGFLVAPVSGDVQIHVETNRKLHLILEGLGKAEAEGDQPSVIMNVSMTVGQRYPMELIFWNDAGLGVFTPATHKSKEMKSGDAFFTIRWAWEGQPPTAIPVTALHHEQKQMAPLAHIVEPDPASINMRQFIRIDGEHVVVYHEEGRFGGWPANNGIWSWGDEILVGITKGYFRYKKHHHSYDQTKPGVAAQARSTDGGRTWTANLVFSGPAGTSLATDFPALAVDPTNGNLYAAWSDGQTLSFSTSSDQGSTWSSPIAVNIAPASTAM